MLRITSHASAPTYTVTRAQLGTVAAPYLAGQRVAITVPYWVPRQATLVYHDHDAGEEWEEWVGYLDRVETSQDGTRIDIAGTEFYKRWSQVEANKDAPDLLAGDHSFRVVGDVLRGSVRPVGGSRVRTTTGPVLIQIAGALVRGEVIGAGQAVIRIVDQPLGPAELGSELDLEASYRTDVITPAGTSSTLTRVQATSRAVEGSAWEILAWVKGDPDVTATGGTDALHPVRIAQYLLEVLPPWGYRLPIDTAGFAAARNATPGLEIDRLLLGLDGKPYKVFAIVEGLLKAYGFAPTITRDGKYSVRRYTALDIASVAAAQDSELSPYGDGPLKRAAPLAAGVSAITATVGALPWVTPPRVEISAVGGSRRAVLLGAREAVDYDLRTVDPRRAEEVALLLAATAETLHYGLPRLTIRVADWRVTGADLDLLADVVIADLGLLADPWWVDAQGQRVSTLTGRLDAVGRIVGRRLDTVTRTYELTLLLLAFATGSFARERAPAGVITAISYDGGTDTTTITLSDQLTEEEAQYFTAGDELQICDRSGAALLTLTAPVGSVSGDTVLVRQEVAGTYVGEVLRLGTSAVYANASRYPFTTRPYVYYADASGEIARPASAVEPADLYGGGLGVL